MKFPKLVVALALAFGVALVPQGLRADEVTVAGTAGAIFNSTNGSSLSGLSYNGSTFNVTTSGGFAAIGSGPATANFNNLGSLTLTGLAAGYSDTFVLTVTFTNPVVIQGTNQATESANLMGNVTTTSQGGVLISFTNPSPILFTFANSGSAGQFDFSVNNVSVTPGNTVALTGQITGASQSPVPEPASLLLFGTGLSGMAAALRKRISM